MKKIFILSIVISSVIFSCKNHKATIYDYPDPVDTSNQPIEEQEKKTYELDGVFADNQFEGARLNGFEQVDKHTFKVSILPENTPINKSPWFAFKMWSEKKRRIFLILDYTHANHRYVPKLSSDGKNWTPIDSNSIRYIDTSDVTFPLLVGPDTLYVSGQELATSLDNKHWVDTLSRAYGIEHGSYGQSVKNRDLLYMDLYEKSKKDKPMVVILSRQHPPEVTGYFAMQHFVEALLDTNVLARSYRKHFRTLILPMLNPDGVDMGHWRHNANGVDLNRDWGIYFQPEVKQTVDFIVRESKMNDNQVILGLDFHSTQKDIFYTYADSMRSVIPAFNDYWIYGIDEALPDYKPREEPSGITQPFSKVWFYTQFGAESVTYEIGDETPRDFIAQKARVAANEMLKLLIFYAQK